MGLLTGTETPKRKRTPLYWWLVLGAVFLGCVYVGANLATGSIRDEAASSVPDLSDRVNTTHPAAAAAAPTTPSVLAAPQATVPAEMQAPPPLASVADAATPPPVAAAPVSDVPVFTGIVPKYINIPSIGVKADAFEAQNIMLPDPRHNNEERETFKAPDDLVSTNMWSADVAGNRAPYPGEDDMSVFLGHSEVGGGYGVFNDIASLPIGADILVGNDQDARHFRVIGQVTVSKQQADGLVKVLEGHPPNARIALITCSGEFNTSISSSEDNTVVFGELIE